MAMRSRAKFNSKVFNAPAGAETVRLLTVIVPGKFAAVVGKIPTALKPALVMNTDWPAAGGIPSDHVKSSQWPLAGLFQLFTCARQASELQNKPATIIKDRNCSFPKTACCKFIFSLFPVANRMWCAPE